MKWVLQVPNRLVKDIEQDFQLINTLGYWNATGKTINCQTHSVEFHPAG
jgi:hypothetical protein